jgi:hypothetical protein
MVRVDGTVPVQADGAKRMLVDLDLQRWRRSGAAWRGAAIRRWPFKEGEGASPDHAFGGRVHDDARVQRCGARIQRYFRSYHLQLTEISVWVVFGQHVSEKTVACSFLPCMIMSRSEKIAPFSCWLCGPVWVERWRDRGRWVMSPRRSAAVAALCGTVILAASVAAELARFGSHVENAAVPIEPSGPRSVSADAPADAPQVSTMGEKGVSAADEAIVDVASLGSHPTGSTETPTEQVAAEGEPDPVENGGKQVLSFVGTFDECFVAETCIDQYLWSMYQQTPKLDTIRVPEQIKVTVKKKGKPWAVIKTVIKLVEEDFTWKDPKAAQKAGMSLMDYVIGGMDRSFKLRLYFALCTLDEAGLSPGITSGFRDDYRQSLASGNKAATDSSYHGGSRRGGYGHGLAVDLVSTKGETRLERFHSSEKLWKWIDEHGKEFGIGRPYLDKDPPHVAPIDGKEYADHRGGANAPIAARETNRSHRLAMHDDHRVRKRLGASRSLRVRNI